MANLATLDDSKAAEDSVNMMLSYQAPSGSVPNAVQLHQTATKLAGIEARCLPRHSAFGKSIRGIQT